MEKKKINMKPINRENITDHLVEYQLAMIGKTLEEAKSFEGWYSKWSMTEEQYSDLKAYALPLIKKVFKCNSGRARSTFEWFNLSFGLRIKKDDK
jgi:hypothetical protein